VSIQNIDFLHNEYGMLNHPKEDVLHSSFSILPPDESSDSLQVFMAIASANEAVCHTLTLIDNMFLPAKSGVSLPGMVTDTI
jgi:hypothetical protein